MPESLTRQQWVRVGVAGYVPTLLSSIGFGAIVPLVALSAIHLGAGVTFAAFIVSLQFIAQISMDLPAGYIAARFGEKRAIIAACLIDTVMLGLVAVLQNLPILMIATASSGMSGAIFSLARQTFITEAVPLRFRARALSTLGGVFRIGYFIGPLAGSFIVAHGGLSPAYAFASGASFVAAVVTFVIPDVVKDAPTTKGSPTTAAAPVDKRPRPKVLAVAAEHKRALLTLGLGATTIMVVRSSRQTLIPLWAASQGISASATALIYSISMLCEVLLFLPGGMIMDRFGRWAACIPSMLVMGGCLIALAFTHSPTSIMIDGIILGIGNGIASGIVMTLGSDASPDVGRPQFLSAFRLFSDSGNMLGPLTVTVISSFAPLAAATITLGCVGLLGAAWLNRWVPRGRFAHIRRTSPPA